MNILFDKVFRLFSFSFEEAKEEHAHQLTTLRLLDTPVTLKPTPSKSTTPSSRRRRIEDVSPLFTCTFFNTNKFFAL